MKGLTHWLTIALSLCALGSEPAAAQPSQYRLETTAGWGGMVTAFQRVGNYGYCGSGERLVVLDMTNEASPQLVFSYDINGGVRDLLVRGNYLYVTAEDPHPLTTFSLSNPGAPVVTSMEVVPPSAVLRRGEIRMCEALNIMYLLDELTASPIAMDMTDPAHPVMISYVTLRDPANVPVGAIDAQIQGTLLNVGDNHGWFRVFDLQTNPTFPPHVAAVKTNTTAGNGTVRCVTLDGDRALVQTEQLSAGIVERISRLIDISNPMNPVVIGVPFTFLGPAERSVLKGNLAFVADYGSPGPKGYGTNGPYPASAAKGLAVVDFSNPSSPTQIGAYRTNWSQIRDVRVEGNRAYLFCGGQGLEIMNITSPASPTRIGGYYSPGQLRSSFKEGNRVYVSDEWNGITVLDVSNPAITPPVLGVYRTPEIDGQSHTDIIVRNNIVYLASWYSGISIVDFTNPAAPVRLSAIQPTYPNFWTPAIDLDGNILRVSVTQLSPPVSCQLRNYNVASPGSPVLVGQTAALWPGGRIVSKDGIAFMGMARTFPDNRYGIISTPSRLEWFNCTNPAAPSYVGESSTLGGSDLAVQGNILLVAKDELYGPSGPGTMNIMDVSSPLTPQFITSVTSNSEISPVAMIGARAYFGGWATTASTNWAYDLTNPLSPLVLAHSDPFIAARIHTSGDFMYATSSDKRRHGLAIQRFRCYANCDLSTTPPVLNVQDFACYLNKFASGDAYANCDGSTAAPTLNVQDFSCFLNLFAGGCNE